MTLKTLLIANPRAGAGRAEAVAQAVASGMSVLGAGVRTVLTTGEGDAAYLAARERDADLVVAIGGDGTLNEVVRGLISAGGPLPAVGFVPAGSGNIARLAFGLPRHPERAAVILATGRTREIDVGVATRDGAPVGVFLLWLSAGVDAVFIHDFAEVRSKGERVGELQRLCMGVRSFRRYGYPPLTLGIDDQPARVCASGIVANVGELGVAGNLAPNARPDDGVLNTLAIQDRSCLGWVPLGMGLLAGRLAYCPGVYAATAARVSLRSESPVPFHLDGEAVGWLPVDVTLYHRTLKLIVP